MKILIVPGDMCDDVIINAYGKLKAENEALRKVVDAAKKWREGWDFPEVIEYFPGDITDKVLIRAIDKYERRKK